MGKFIDLTGERFGKLTVIYRNEDIICNNGNHRVVWRCQCDCGNETSVRRDALVSGRTKSCGACNNDLKGKIFGRLTAIEKVGTDEVGHTIWKCRCDCGKEVNVLATNLIRQYTLSCGCLHSEICSKQGEDLIGQKFGKLKVLSLVSVAPRKYLCECECGGQTVVEPGNLKDGHTQSCGCIISLGQEKINTYLTAHKINFKPEYTARIAGFVGVARYDFAILNKTNEVQYLIEFHGRQHYEVAYSWNDSVEQLLERQRKDSLKRKWAKENNIPLYEIPYWELDNINEILEEILKTIQNDY